MQNFVFIFYLHSGLLHFYQLCCTACYKIALCQQHLTESNDVLVQGDFEVASLKPHIRSMRKILLATEGKIPL